MKATWSLLLLALCAIAILPGRAMAQNDNPLDPVIEKSRFLVGPVIGANRNFHSGGFHTITADESCPKFEKGSGWGFLGGITAEFQLGQTWSIIPRLMYESRPGSFTAQLPDALVQIPDATDPSKSQIVTQTVSATSTIQYSMLTAEVMYKQEFAHLGGMALALAGGPEVNMILSAKNRQVQDLVQPANARFINPSGFATENNGRRLIFQDGDIALKKSMRIALKAGLQAEVGLFHNAWIMTPGLYYDLGLTDVTSTENWKVNSFMFMVDFRRAF